MSKVDSYPARAKAACADVSPECRETSLVERIASHAAADPGGIAIVAGTQRTTWAELHRRSNQLAARLRGAGAGPECCVALLLERSADFVAAALAVLKAGAAYLPLDSSMPPERAAFILADAGVPLLLTHRGLARNLQPGPWRLIDLDHPEQAAPAAQPAGFDAPPLTPDSLAYVIYTSGSTGRPKGVEITHGNLLNLVDWHVSAFGVTDDDRASQVAGLGFDAAGWEIWPTLSAGASLHFADEMTRRSPQALRDWLAAEGVTIAFVPTVLAEQLLHAHWPAGTKLRALLTGADTLHRHPPAGLPFVLVNNYGPTECTVVATSGAVEPSAGGAAAADAKAIHAPPSIGRPIDRCTVLILDESLRPVPAGEAGELCLAGALVGRGYRNNPALTAERFVTLTPASGAPVRVYRTGDRARLLPTGEIAFLGRLDDQIKLRGYRIEPGEIVACLDRHPGVEASAVVARDDVAGTGAEGGDGPGRALVAYVVRGPQARFMATDLREFLAARLPDYMIPGCYVALEALPLTPNGKLDRAALPAPSAANLLPGAGPTAAAEAGAAQHPAAAGIDLEPRIASMVASLLGHPTVGREDNFFMLGGHSMLGAQLVTRIRDAFGVKLALRQLFGAPTVAALSAEVAKLTAARRGDACVARTPVGATPASPGRP